jgi:hypothetical protein
LVNRVHAAVIVHQPAAASKTPAKQVKCLKRRRRLHDVELPNRKLVRSSKRRCGTVAMPKPKINANAPDAHIYKQKKYK